MHLLLARDTHLEAIQIFQRGFSATAQVYEVVALMSDIFPPSLSFDGQRCLVESCVRLEYTSRESDGQRMLSNVNGARSNS